MAKAVLKNQEDYAVDIVKIICAFLVVGIHTNPFAQYAVLDQVFSVLNRVAVPFFFVTSSYYYFKKEKTGKEKIYYFFRIFLMYTVWTCIYYILNWITGYQNIQTEKYFRDYLTKGYWQLWFLRSLIIAIFLFVILIKVIKREKIIYIMAGVVFSLGVMLSTYYQIFSNHHVFNVMHDSMFIQIFGTRNGLFYGLAFVSMGHYFARNKCKLTLKQVLCGCIIFYILLALEGILVVKIIGTEETILWFSMIPLTFCIVSAVKKIKFAGNNEIYRKIRKSSTVIYLIHPIFIMLLEKRITSEMLLFVVVSILSFVISLIIIWIKSKKGFKWVDNLI